jgi:DUF1680 family protein
MTAQFHPPAPAVSPALERLERTEFSFGGEIGRRLQVNERHWLLIAPEANPAMLQMYRDRDRPPRRDLLPWSGEFAGKYLTAATLAYRATGSRSLKAYLRRFVADLIATQDADGYLGPFPKEARMIGPGLWDLWGQYHVMLGLYLWYRETGDVHAFAASRRCADYFCRYFLDENRRTLQAGSEEMNQSSIHIFTLLYRETGEPRYLQMAQAIEKDWETPPSGDYIRASLAGKPFYQTPKPRWESLHGVQAIAELYFITGDPKYRRAFEQIWWTILEGDRHNTGGFSSGEQATGNPYDPRAIETCCTIAWMTITLDMLRMTGDSRAADELELSTWNAVLGAQSPSGRWWTYNTPMDGERKASAHEIVFQARPGSPELNCCSVNGPRGLGILSEWAVMRAPDGIALNYFGPSRFRVPLASGNRVQIVQETRYPLDGAVTIRIRPQREERFTLSLRIPGWSRNTTVKLNGRGVSGVKSGSYLRLERVWKEEDRIEMTVDLSPRWWVGEREAAGKVSVYCGPILMAYDPRFDTHPAERLPALTPQALRRAPQTLERETTLRKAPDAPLLLLRFADAQGGGITLCDFASAGMAGNAYRTWLPGEGFSPVSFSRENPLRLAPP